MNERNAYRQSIDSRNNNNNFGSNGSSSSNSSNTINSRNVNSLNFQQLKTIIRNFNWWKLGSYGRQIEMDIILYFVGK